MFQSCRVRTKTPPLALALAPTPKPVRVCKGMQGYAMIFTVCKDL